MSKRNWSSRQNKKRNKALLAKKMVVDEDERFGPFITEFNPFANLSDSEREVLKNNMGSKGKIDFKDSLEKLTNILQTYDPINILARAATYTLTVCVGEEGIQNTETPDSIHQFHIEILQALILHIDKDSLGDELVPPRVIQETLDQLKILARGFSLSGINCDLNGLSQEERAVHEIQRSVRSYTQSVRNWGYFSQVKRISTELYSYFDDDLLEHIGVSATQIIELFDALVLSAEESESKWLRDLQYIKSKKYTKDQFHAYADLIGQDRAEIDELIGGLTLPILSDESTFSFIWSHYDFQMADIYTYSPADISSLLKISEKTALTILEEFSYSLGELSKHKVEHVFLDNPIWEKPVIKLETDEYFCAMPQVFFSFILLSLNSYIEKTKAKALKERRASYLEDKIEEIVKRRFPSASTVSSVQWKYNDALYETDLISFIDSHAIIVEAKSHKVTKPALRGAPDRIKRHIKEIIIDPSIQSSRFQSYLEDQCRGNSTVDDYLQKQIPVDLKTITKIVRVSVSLENTTAMQEDLNRLAGTGWVSNELDLCPSMNLADFETVFDLLEHPIQIIHYLTRRASLQGEVDFMGCEIDMLGLYLTTLLNVESWVKNTGQTISISQMSAPIDAYYDSRDNGILLDKPKPKISRTFRGILRQLESRNSPRWSEIGVLLNMLTADDQKKLELSIQQCRKVVECSWEEDHDNTVLFIPNAVTDASLAYVQFTNGNEHKRNEFIQNAINIGFEHGHVKRCLVIAKNIDKKLPYSAIALADRNQHYS